MFKPQAISAVLLFLMLTKLLSAAEQISSGDSLPEPLTLEFALSLVDEATPDIRLQQADVMAAEAGLSSAESLTGFNAYLETRAQWVEPAEVTKVQGNEDHRLALIANKTLYDFGRSAAAENAASLTLSARQLLLADSRRQRRLLIMRGFFDVLLADLQFYRYNEEMAVVFIAKDRTQDRRELGQASDLDLLEKEVEYQRIRHLRYKSENEQRRTRAQLARILNRPGKLPSTVAMPELKNLKRKLAEVEAYQSAALHNNASVKALRLQVAAAEQAVNRARSSNNPRLKGQLEAYSYERELGSSDKWRAGMTLEIPLWTGGSSDADVAKAQANLYRDRARLRKIEINIEQAVLESWLDLNALQVRLQEMEAAADYRELYLDRSRALYEMEVKADLGDAMVRVSEAERNLRKVQFDISLGWARLEALVGQDLNVFKPNESTN